MGSGVEVWGQGSFFIPFFPCLAERGPQTKQGSGDSREAGEGGPALCSHTPGGEYTSASSTAPAWSHWPHPTPGR